MKGITGRYIELNDVEDLLLEDEKKCFKFLKLTNTKTFHNWVVQMQYPFDQSDDDEDDDVTNKGVLPTKSYPLSHIPNKWFSIVSWGGGCCTQRF